MGGMGLFRPSDDDGDFQSLGSRGDEPGPHGQQGVLDEFVRQDTGLEAGARWSDLGFERDPRFRLGTARCGSLWQGGDLNQGGAVAARGPLGGTAQPAPRAARHRAGCCPYARVALVGSAWGCNVERDGSTNGRQLPCGKSLPGLLVRDRLLFFSQALISYTGEVQILQALQVR